jgi:DNA-binding response OmpR family regulator
MNIAMDKNSGSPASKIKFRPALDLGKTSAQESAIFSKPEVLLIADGSPGMEMIGLFLQAQGCQVFLAPDGETATEEVGNYYFDLIIIRPTREKLDGLAVLKKVRKINSPTKVMVLGGDPEVTFPLETFEIEADDYLKVPCRASEFYRRVGRCLGREMVPPVKAELTSNASEANQRVLNSLRIFCHDVWISLGSMGASLKLLRNGKSGQMDEAVAESVEQIHSQLSKLVELTENFIGKTVLTDRALNFEPGRLDLPRDIKNQVLDEFTGEQEIPQVTVNLRHKSTNGDGIPLRGISSC